MAAHEISNTKINILIGNVFLTTHNGKDVEFTS